LSLLEKYGTMKQGVKAEKKLKNQNGKERNVPTLDWFIVEI
jgi:hypothetical protein